MEIAEEPGQQQLQEQPEATQAIMALELEEGEEAQEEHLVEEEVEALLI